MASRIKEGIKDLFASKDDLDYPDGYTRQRIYADPRALNGNLGPAPVLELRVPMCCEKCVEKVKEAVEECDGVKNVICDQYNQRVTVTGFVDPNKILRRVRKVKKKSEFFRDGTFVNRTSTPITPIAPAPVVAQSRSLQHVPALGSTRYTSNPLVRTGSSGFGRFPHEGRMAPIAPNMVVPRMAAPQLVRRQPSTRQPHMNALVPVDLRRDFTGIRRMPSFKNYRHHDAEYIAMDDDNMMSEPRYVARRNQRPVMHAPLRPQLSFSRVPVTNPHYLKHVESEYY